MKKSWMICGAVSSSVWAASPAPTPAPAADDSLFAEGRANVARARTRPEFVDGPEPVLPEAEKAQGHHGTVVVEGVVAADGRMHSARVKVSSRAPALDAIALDAAKATKFTPARDEAGSPLPVHVLMPFELVAYKTPKGGLFEYRCGQFVRDMDWWRTAHPEKQLSDHELYKMALGLSFVSGMQARGADPQKFLKAAGAFPARWAKAVEKCRAKPGMLQKDALFR